MAARRDVVEGGLGSGLVVAVAPYDGESDIGYLRRLAQENCYGTWGDLVRICGLKPSRLIVPAAIQELSDTLGLEREWLEAVSAGHATGRGLYDRRYLKHGHDAVCPDCLSEGPYIRHAWRHSFVTACPTHGNVLVERCPCCGQELGWDRLDLLKCECGFDLRFVPRTCASDAHRWISARVQSDWTEVHGMPALLDVNECELLAELLTHLSSRFVPGENNQRVKGLRANSVDDAVAFLRPMETILGDWPHSFAEHVKQRLDAGPADSTLLSSRLGFWYTGLSGLCARDTFDAFWRVFSDVIVERFDGPSRHQRALRPSPGKERQFVSLTHASKVLKASRECLVAGVEAGRIQATTTRMGATYQFAQISLGELARLSALKDGWMPVTEALRVLGIGQAGMVLLIKVGAVQQDLDWRLSPPKPGPIDRDAIAALAGKLLGFVQPRECADSLPFNALTGQRVGEGKALAALYTAICQGELRPVAIGDGGKVGDLRFAREEVARFVGSAALSASITLPQLEALTGWKYEALAHWVDLGLLRTEVVKLSGVDAKIVPVSALVEFMREFLPVSELARHLGSKASGLTVKLGALGVPVIGLKRLSDGAQRGGLVRLGDYAKAINKER